MHEQAIPLEGVGNARQIGGYKVGGRTVKRDVLIRCGKISGISAASAEKLSQQYRLQYVIDLRMREEHDLDPDVCIPGCEMISLPVMETEDMDDPDPELAAAVSDPRATLRDRFDIIYRKGIINDSIYPDFIFKERGKKAYSEFFRLLLKADADRAVLWHCTDGKDRTGLAAVLLLSALGASRETILGDYMLTNEFNKEKLNGVRGLPWFGSLTHDQQEILLFVSGGVIEGFMSHTLDLLDGRYGGAEGYIREELGIDKADISRLREKYLV